MYSFNLKWLWMCRSFVAVGVDPAVMGIGPAVAIPAAVKAAGLEISDIDLFEINEVYFSFSLTFPQLCLWTATVCLMYLNWTSLYT
jgi:acetyl-CoA acetyltransferase